MSLDLFPAGFATIDLPEELKALADGDLQALEWLVLAEAWRDADRVGQSDITGQALRLLPGTTGQRLVAWEDLHEVVGAWHAWDLAKDGQGHVYIDGVPSTRETADQRVVDVLDWIRSLHRDAA